MPQPTKSVLFVCLGNICRSPTAEGVFRELVAEQGMAQQLEIDSAGTSNWHIGKAPDSRAIAEAASRGIDIAGFKGRQANEFDMDFYDYVIAMDVHNHYDLQQLAGRENAHKVTLFLDYAAGIELTDVPDPYYGGEDGFSQVYGLIEQASAGLLDEIKASLRSNK